MKVSLGRAHVFQAQARGTRADGCRVVLHFAVPQEDQVRKVGLSRYSRVSRTAFGLNGKKRIAVLRAGGAILGEQQLSTITVHSTAATAPAAATMAASNVMATAPTEVIAAWTAAVARLSLLFRSAVHNLAVPASCVWASAGEVGLLHATHTSGCVSVVVWVLYLRCCVRRQGGRCWRLWQHHP